VFGVTTPFVVGQEEVARKDDFNPRSPSPTILTIAMKNYLQEGILIVPLVLRNISGDKINLLFSHKSIQFPIRDDSMEFMKPLQFEATFSVIQYILVQVYHVGFLSPIEVGFEDFHVMNYEERTIQLGKFNVTSVARKINCCAISMHQDIKDEIQVLTSSMKVLSIEEESKGCTWEDDKNKYLE
jgi:hypothetical protein